MQTNPRRIDLDTLLSLFPSEQTQNQIRNLLDMDGTTGLAVFECQDFNSSEFGRRKALAYGPQRQCKTLAEIKNFPIGKVPSQFKWCTCYYNQTMIAPIDHVRTKSKLGAIYISRDRACHTYRYGAWSYRRARHLKRLVTRKGD